MAEDQGVERLPTGKQSLANGQRQRMYRSAQRRARREGLLFGLVSGLTFALAAWGLDAWQLTMAGATLGWAKLAVGGLVCLPLGGIVGWFVARIDHGLAAAISWMLAGALFGYLAGRLPTEGLSRLVGLVEPRFAGIEAYPLVSIAEGKANLVVILSGILGAFTGIFELVAIDLAAGAHSRFGHAAGLFLCAPILILAGVTADIVCNRQLREPQVNIAHLIRFALDHRGLAVDRQMALDMHLGALRPIDSVLGEPRQIVLGDYDPLSLISVSVEIEFEGGWVRCILLDGKPSVCRLSDPIYEEGLACLLASEDLKGEGCEITVSQAAREWFAARVGEIGPKPDLTIRARWATVVLAEVVGQDGRSFECRFRGAQPVVLEACAGIGSGYEAAPGATLDPYDRLKVIRPDCLLAGTRGEVPGSVSAEAECWRQDPDSHGWSNPTPTAGP